jgi:hypothetical protein
MPVEIDHVVPDRGEASARRRGAELRHQLLVGQYEIAHRGVERGGRAAGPAQLRIGDLDLPGALSRLAKEGRFERQPGRGAVAPFAGEHMPARFGLVEQAVDERAALLVAAARRASPQPQLLVEPQRRLPPGRQPRPQQRIGDLHRRLRGSEPRLAAHRPLDRRACPGTLRRAGRRGREQRGGHQQSGNDRMARHLPSPGRGRGMINAGRPAGQLAIGLP